VAAIYVYLYLPLPNLIIPFKTPHLF